MKCPQCGKRTTSNACFCNGLRNTALPEHEAEAVIDREYRDEEKRKFERHLDHQAGRGNRETW